MTTLIVLFLAFGLLFGLATYSRRHLFSEGPATRDRTATANTFRDRLGWVLICSSLWPLLALAGLHSAWLLARRRAASAPRPRD